MRLFLSRLAVLIGFSLALCGGSTAVAAPDWRVTPDDMVLGNPKAKVTVIEYASASCPHCARFDVEVFPAFKAKYIDTGQVRYVMREFLTPPEEVAAAGFLVARCGGKAKYFTILDQVFQHQTEIYQTNDLQGVMERAGGTAGLTPAQVDACIYDGAALGALNLRVDTYIKRDGISGTPTFVINGHPLGAAGEPTLASLDAAIAAARKGR